MPGLLDLPPEILLQVHFAAQNPLLALSHPTIHGVLHHAHTSYIANYLFHLYQVYGPDQILVRATRHPICDVPVAREIGRLWNSHQQNSAHSLAKGILTSKNEEKQRKARRSYKEQQETCLKKSDDDGRGEENENAKGPSLMCSELPRRLFRNLSKDSPIPSLLDYLLSTYEPSLDSHKGYPLCRALLAANTTLINYLLKHGADPTMNDNLPIRVAVQIGRLDLVKSLLEPPAVRSSISIDRVQEAGGINGPSSIGDGREDIGNKATSHHNSTPPGKRFKPNKRAIRISEELVELAVKGGHEDIINYFVHERGVMPPLKSIMRMGTKAKALFKRKNRGTSVHKRVGSESI